MITLTFSGGKQCLKDIPYISILCHQINRHPYYLYITPKSVLARLAHTALKPTASIHGHGAFPKIDQWSSSTCIRERTLPDRRTATQCLRHRTEPHNDPVHPPLTTSRTSTKDSVGSACNGIVRPYLSERL
jgi:hypothetical protein